MSNRKKSTVLSLLLIPPLAAHALKRQELLPPDAQMYLRVSNATNCWNGLKRSPLGKLWADPQFQDFLGSPDAETWEDLLFDGESDAEDAIMLEEFKMLKGEVIAAADREMGDVILVAAMERADFLRSLELDEKLNDVSDEPDEIVRSRFQGVEIIQRITDGDAEDASWQAFVDGTFVMGHSREWVERCIVRLQKEGIEEPKGNPVINLNLPLKPLVDEWVEEMDGHGAAASTRSLVDALGLGGLENLSVSIELKKDEMTIDGNLQVADLSRGLLGLLDLQPSEIPAVAFVPADISSFETGRIDLLGLWKELPDILGSVSPAAKLQLDTVVGMFTQQTGVDLEQDLLGNLGSQYISFAQVGDGRQISVIALELKDGPAFRTALEALLASPTLQMQLADSLETEEFLDHTIYTVKAADPAEGVAFGVVGGYLVYSQPEGLRQVIRGLAGDGAFLRSPLIKGLREHTPARAFGFGAVDWKKNMVVFVRKLRQPQYAAAFEEGWKASEVPLALPDLDRLPPAKHIASFFNVSYQYVEAAGNGLHQRAILKY